MRKSRKKRNKKKGESLVILSKVLIIVYSLSISTTLLSSPTVAHFSIQKTSNNFIQAGYWWDGSILSFPGLSKAQNVKACAPVEINVQVKNEGLDMVSTTTYKVFYIEDRKANPSKIGDPISEGTLRTLKKGESSSLSFNATKNGAYMFMLNQHPDFKKTNGIKSIEWSEKIMVNCEAAKQEVDTKQNQSPKDSIENAQETTEEVKLEDVITKEVEENPENSDNESGEDTEKPSTEENQETTQDPTSNSQTEGTKEEESNSVDQHEEEKTDN